MGGGARVARPGWVRGRDRGRADRLAPGGALAVGSRPLVRAAASGREPSGRPVPAFAARGRRSATGRRAPGCRSSRARDAGEVRPGASSPRAGRSHAARRWRTADACAPFRRVPTDARDRARAAPRRAVRLLSCAELHAPRHRERVRPVTGTSTAPVRGPYAALPTRTGPGVGPEARAARGRTPERSRPPVIRAVRRPAESGAPSFAHVCGCGRSGCLWCVCTADRAVPVRPCGARPGRRARVCVTRAPTRTERLPVRPRCRGPGARHRGRTGRRTAAGRAVRAAPRAREPPATRPSSVGAPSRPASGTHGREAAAPLRPTTPGRTRRARGSAACARSRSDRAAPPAP